MLIILCNFNIFLVYYARFKLHLFSSCRPQVSTLMLITLLYGCWMWSMWLKKPHVTFNANMLKSSPNTKSEVATVKIQDLHTKLCKNPTVPIVGPRNDFYLSLKLLASSITTSLLILFCWKKQTRCICGWLSPYVLRSLYKALALRNLLVAHCSKQLPCTTERLRSPVSTSSLIKSLKFYKRESGQINWRLQ